MDDRRDIGELDVVTRIKVALSQGMIGRVNLVQLSLESPATTAHSRYLIYAG